VITVYFLLVLFVTFILLLRDEKKVGSRTEAWVDALVVTSRMFEEYVSFCLQMPAEKGFQRFVEHRQERQWLAQSRKIASSRK
jgi:hypothetical protein